jgi:hypothetical protein
MSEEKRAKSARTKRHVCDYCGEPATVRIEPDRGGRIDACADHEERAVVEGYSGAVVEL